MLPSSSLDFYLVALVIFTIVAVLIHLKLSLIQIERKKTQFERLQEDFTVMLVHELRAPLTVLRGGLNVLSQDPNSISAPQGKNLLLMMESSTLSLLSLVNDLLDLTSAQKGAFQVFKKKSNLLETVQNRRDFFLPLAQEKSLTLNLNTSLKDHFISFDPDRITQVLDNLLSNAIKFTPYGGSIDITLNYLSNQSAILWRFGSDNRRFNSPNFFPSIIIGISDTGIGIPQDKFDDLFSKFKQFHPSQGKQGVLKGNGLGLAVSKGIIESHGGKIFFESRLHRGSSFYFTLPLS